MSRADWSSSHKSLKLNLAVLDGSLLNFGMHFNLQFMAIATLLMSKSYMKNQFHGIAAQCVAGLSVTNGNYYQALEILRYGFGQTHKTTNANIRNILERTAPKSNLNSLRIVSDSIEYSSWGLESLVSEDKFWCNSHTNYLQQIPKWYA